jgi:hypothetical protein
MLPTFLFIGLLLFSMVCLYGLSYGLSDIFRSSDVENPHNKTYHSSPATVIAAAITAASISIQWGRSSLRVLTPLSTGSNPQSVCSAVTQLFHQLGEPGLCGLSRYHQKQSTRSGNKQTGRRMNRSIETCRSGFVGDDSSGLSYGWGSGGRWR